MTDEELMNYNYTGVVKHPHMSMRDRAGQFAPFAALTGLEEMVDEELRTTDQKVILTDERKDEINAILLQLQDIIKEKPEVKITYFVKDKLKDGGTYFSTIKRVCKIHESEGCIELEDHKKIEFSNISSIEIIKQ